MPVIVLKIGWRAVAGLEYTREPLEGAGEDFGRICDGV